MLPLLDPHHLQRFLDAQELVYPQVVSELTAGRKRSHWMWFIFPQIRGLGFSDTAQHFAIASLDEACAFLAHTVLGHRLRECTELVLQHPQRSAAEIFGYPDDLKLHSSLTLFAQATGQPAVDSADAVFASALRIFFAGRPDRATLDRLSLP